MPKYEINLFQAIVTNYVVCIITGCAFIGQVPFTFISFSQPWFVWSLIMGAGFISVFNLIAFSTDVNGITPTIIANKLSLVIPVVFAIITYKEHAGIMKYVGISLSVPAIYLTTKVSGNGESPRNLILPVLLFLGGGFLDTLMNFVQLNFLNTSELQSIYTIFCFSVAGSAGLLILLFLVAAKKTTIKTKNILAGICLGIPNYFSIYFFIKMLHSSFLQSSASIPVLNIGILVASSLAAILLFKEEMNRLRVMGMVLGIVAILLIAYGDKF